MKIRIIIQSSGNGENEQVIFTDDFGSHPSEFSYPDCSVDSDDIVECDLPSGFPLNSMLVKE